MRKSIVIVYFLFGIIISASAQVTSVKYLIDYNESSSLYDCKIVIDAGKATTYVQRKQFTTQYSLVVPTGAQVSLEESHNPLQDNHNYAGTIPCIWELAPPFTAPAGQPESDFYYLYPTLTPQLAYNDLLEGDTITLFSLNIDADPCENSVRPFEKGVDSNAGFSCIFTFAGGTQTYSGNLTSNYTNNLSPFDTISICLNDCLDLSPTLTCIAEENQFFEWSTGENTEHIEVCPTESTTYYLLVKDSVNTILDSLFVYVDVNPIVLELNDLEICVNTNTVVTSSIPGGTWQATNPAVATIDANTGVITGDSPGEAKFRYIAPNGYSKLSETLFVLENPTIYVPEFMCIGGQTEIYSNSEGIWTSNDTSVLAVFDNGLVEGMAEGMASLMFTDTSTHCSVTVDIDILEEHFATNTGSDTICAFETTTLAPFNGAGYWIMSYTSGPIVATLDNLGNVTGLTEGKVVFSFISVIPGCEVTVLDTIYVFDLPEVEYLGDDRICVGDTTSFQSDSDMLWGVSHPTIASIDTNTGTITGLSQGVTSINLVEPSTGCSANAAHVLVDPPPTVSAESFSICIGTTSAVYPQSGGVWTALHPEIADLDSTTIMGVAEGIAGFLFTSSATGCVSDTLFITIHTPPMTHLNGPSEICSGEVTFLEPTSGGTWTMSDHYVASVSNAGIVIGISSGTATGVFTDSTTGCASEPSDTITVLPFPFAGIFEPIKLCVGETHDFSPNTFIGFWESDNPEVALVDSLTGHITTLSEGTAYINFIDDISGCSTSTVLKIFNYPEAIYTGDSILCIGELTNLAPTSGGTWTSSDSNIAEVTNSGIVTTLTSGITTFVYTDSNSGCSSEPLTITVLPVSDPSCIVSTKDLENKKIKLYPNPAKDYINIESESFIESISIYSLGYQKLKEEMYKNGTNSTQVSTAGINPGLYIIALKTEGTTYFRKIIID